MKYKEWIGDLEGMLPDVGQVSKGRVLLIDTDAKAEALKGHEKSLSNLTLEEGEARWQKQVNDAKAIAKEEALNAPEAQPEVPQVSLATTPNAPATIPTTDVPVEADVSATTKGGKK
ncbi:hypothetical protein [Deinococcus altitudinis]|uniref:hypothetical protein n=1 Tax=Deinococcus altitudinis TaxID=468914 RepID=UPI0038919AD2